MLMERSLYNGPPHARTKLEDNPTLLYSWWCTIFAAVIILVRLSGRLVRNDMLFREDKIMFASMVPLIIRMAFIHVVLIWGTNNADLSGITDPTELYHREIGSRLVLAARIFQALFLWTAKFTVLDFLKRMTARFWRRSFERVMQFITWYLVISFVAVILATLLECHPFHNYWRVQPYDQCTQAYIQLITMAVADITSDLLIVIFPIPVILASGIPLKRKLGLILLFSTNIVMVVIVANRVPAVIRHHGQQQYRTVWASSEVLAASAVSNAIVIGSFLRDRGVKKAKYKFGSQTDSMDKRSVRRPTLTNTQWGSDEDLAADLGYRLDPELCERPSLRPAGPVTPVGAPGSRHYRQDSDTTPITSSRDWQFPTEHAESSRASEDSTMKAQKPSDSFANALPPDQPMVSPRSLTVVHPKSNTSFFDIGGLLETNPQRSRRSSATLVAGLTPTQSNVLSQNDGDGSHSRRGSRALLADIGGLMMSARGLRSQEGSSQWPLQEIEEHEMQPRSHLAPPSHKSRSQSRSRSRSPATALSLASRGSHPPSGVQTPTLAPNRERRQSLQDVGGLLPLDYTRSLGLQDPGGLLAANPAAAQAWQASSGPLTSATHTTASQSEYFTPHSSETPAGSRVPTPQPTLQQRLQADSPDTIETLVGSASSSASPNAHIT